MMRQHYSLFTLLALLLATGLASCSSDSFKVDGKLEQLDGNMVRVAFRGDSGIVDLEVNVDDKGQFTVEGAASQPAIVTVSTRRGEPLAMMVAVNGDRLKVTGDASNATGIKVKGNKVNEEWQLFRDEHKAFYSDPNPSRLDASIEKYVREHPDDILSTILLIADYSNYTDRDKVDKLLKGIHAEARPESLASLLTSNPAGRKSKITPRLMSLTLIKHGGNFEEIKLTGHTTLITLWANPPKDRQILNQKLKGIDPDIHLLDVLAESDTLRWHKAIAGESRQHYWAPGGPLEQGIQLLGINSMPWYAVLDTTGLVIYSGPNLDTAITTATRQHQ